MNNVSKNGSAWAFAAISIAACVYAFYTHAVWTLYSNTDAGWLIQTGQYILDHGLPKTNMFSWTIPDSPIVAYQWLFEIAAASLFRFGSMWLLGCAACLVLGTLILFVLPRIWTDKGLPVFLPFAVLALVQTPNWFHARPQLISYCLTLAFACLLERYRSTGKIKYVLPLPPLMVLWANTHLLWTFGWFMVFVYLGGRLWRKKSVPVALTAILVACSGAVLVNPYGFRLIAYVSSFFTGGQWGGQVWEMLPAYSTGTSCLYFLPVSAAVLTLTLARRKVPAEALILSGTVAAAAFFAQRFQPLALITMWTYLGDAILALQWEQFLPSLPPSATAAVSRRWFGACQAATAISISIGIWFCQVPTIASAWMFYTEDAFPLLAAYQKVCTPEDRLLNEDKIGSFLIGMQAGPVFFDTRLDNYPKPFLEATTNCLKAKGNWPDLLDRWQVTQVLVQDIAPLNQEFMYLPDWTLVLHDGKFAWWTRTTPRTNAALRRWSLSDDRIQDSALPSWIVKNTMESRAARYLLLARIDRAHHKPHQAIQEAEMGLKLLPQSSALQNELTLCGQSL